MDEKIEKKLWSIATNYIGKSPYFINLKYKEKLNLLEAFPKEYSRYCLELGCGWGEVAIELAKSNPNSAWILMEKNKGRINVAIQQIKKLGITNIRFIPMNFQWFLEDIFLPNSFDFVLLNFPDPWPKNKHHKHRTVNKTFIDTLYKILKDNGKFLFATDHGGYGRSVIRQFRLESRFSYQKEYSFIRNNFPVSVFEKEKREENKRIYYVEREKHL